MSGWQTETETKFCSLAADSSVLTIYLEWDLYIDLDGIDYLHDILDIHNTDDIEWVKPKSFYNSFCFHKNVQDWMPDKRRTKKN